MYCVKDVVGTPRARVPSIDDFWTPPRLTWCGLNKHPVLNLKESNLNRNDTHRLNETYTHLPWGHWHTLVIVTETHHIVPRIFSPLMKTYMNHHLEDVRRTNTVWILESGGLSKPEDLIMYKTVLNIVQFLGEQRPREKESQPVPPYHGMLVTVMSMNSFFFLKLHFFFIISVDRNVSS